MINLDAINAWPESEARAAFLKCCGAKRWAEKMTALRPFAGERELADAARQIWRELPPADWLTAFAAHPKIGGAGGNAAAWSATEQAGIAGAAEATMAALAVGNRQYEAKFGYLFIVCATGKRADELLALLRQRLNNDPRDEMSIAAAEQEKIMLLRLQRMTQ